MYLIEAIYVSSRFAEFQHIPQRQTANFRSAWVWQLRGLSVLQGELDRNFAFTCPSLSSQGLQAGHCPNGLQ
jgi:hypothetical protein